MAQKKKIVTPAVKALRKEVLTLAKRANERLRALEVNNLTSASNAYRYIEKNLSNKNYMRTDYKGNVRFRTDTASMNIQLLQQLESKLNEFFQSKTTTKTEIKSKYNKAYITFKNNTGYKGSFEEYMNLWKDARFEVMQKEFGVSESIGIMREIKGLGISSQDDILDAITTAQLNKNYSEYSIIQHIKSHNNNLSSKPSKSRNTKKRRKQ